MYKSKWILAAATAWLFVGLAPVQADTLNGSPNLIPDGTSSDATVDWAAESFTVGTTFSLTGVEFYSNEYTPLWDGTLDYAIFASDGSKPASTPLDGGQGHDPVYAKTFLVDNGSSDNSIVEYDFSLATPLTLAPGTYWIGLHLQNDYAFTDLMAWDATTTPGAQVSASASEGDFSNWQLQGMQLTLGVAGRAVQSSAPEPASIALGGLGLACVCLYRRRSR